MNALLRSWALSSGLLAALGLTSAAALPGCGEEKKKQDVEADAGAEQGPQKPKLDPKLAAAVKAAESAQAPPSKAGGDGPPENGVFAAGQADKAVAPGAPAKLELLGEGAAPRVLLAPAPPADEQKEAVSITVRQQRTNSIQIEYALTLKVDKPKDEKKTEGPKSFKIVGKVGAATPPPQVSRELSDKLAKLKGTELRYTLGPSGGATEVGYTLAKDADPSLGEAVVKGLVDAVSLAMPPLPQKPVGLGAYWIVTDRAPSFGVEAIRYRVYKVEKVDKDLATLSLEVRQYAVKDEADLGTAAQGQKMNLTRFESQGKGRVDWTAAALLPARGETSLLTALVGAVGNGGQQGVLQVEVSARFAADTKK